MDVPADPYECGYCKWDWRRRGFAKFCEWHQERYEALRNRPMARLYDLIPLTEANEQSVPVAPQPDTETPRSGPRFQLSYERMTDGGTARG